MSTPPQPLLLPIPAPGGAPRYRLVQDWRHLWTHQGRISRLTIPRGFETDGASVPRLLWTLTGITPDGLHRAAALAHDYLYHHAGRLPPRAHQHWRHSGRWADPRHPWTRAEADRLFARLLRESGVPPTRRRLMYLGVRLGGWPAWHRPRA